MNLRRRLQEASPLVSGGGILLILLLMAVFRALLLDSRMRPLAACRGCMALLTLQHDAAVSGVLLLVFGLTQFVRSKALRKGLLGVICLAIVLYGLGLLVVFMYNTYQAPSGQGHRALT